MIYILFSNKLDSEIFGQLIGYIWSLFSGCAVESIVHFDYIKNEFEELKELKELKELQQTTVSCGINCQSIVLTLARHVMKIIFFIFIF